MPCSATSPATPDAIPANRTVQDALIAADRLFEIMDLERDRDTAHATVDATASGDIELEHVTFRYGARTARCATFRCGSAVVR